MRWRARRIEAKDAYLFLHGSTIAINTLLERTGAQTALLITEGFRDIYEIGRINRPDAYNLFFSKHEPLMRRSLRFEVPERLRADGAVHKPLDEAAVRSLARGSEGAAASRPSRSCCCIPIAIRRMSMRVKEIVLRGDAGRVRLGLASNLSQEYREFERVSTVAANAYVGPARRGLSRRTRAATAATMGSAASFYVVQSTGGLFPIDACAARMRAHAGIRPRRGRHRRAGDLRSSWACAMRSPSTWAAPRRRPASSATASR